MRRKRLRRLFLYALIFLVGFVFSSSADKKTTVVVLDLEATGVKQSEAQILSDYVRDAIFKTGKYRLVDRKQLEAALKELKLSMSGLSEEELVKLGKVLQAQKMVSGKLGKIGNTYTVYLQLMDIQTARIEQMVNDRCSQCNTDQLFSLVTNAALKLVGTSPSPPPSPALQPQPTPMPAPQPSPTVDTSSMTAIQIYQLADKEKDIYKRIQLYKLSISKDPDYTPARNDLAVDLIELGRFAEAREQLQAALKIRPTYALAHYNLGRIYYKQKNWNAALAEFRTAAKLNPKRAGYHFRIGLTQNALRNYTASAQAYLKCLEVDPDYIDAYYNLGYVYAAAGNKQAAIYYLQKYIMKEKRPSEKKWVEKAKRKIAELQAQP